jgi:hypothetical protein
VRWLEQRVPAGFGAPQNPLRDAIQLGEQRHFGRRLELGSVQLARPAREARAHPAVARALAFLTKQRQSQRDHRFEIGRRSAAD